MLTMYFKKAHLFLSFALLIFCGQVLALPFMDCCANPQDKMNHSSDSSSSLVGSLEPLPFSGNSHKMHSMSHVSGIDMMEYDNKGKNKVSENSILKLGVDHSCTLCMVLSSAMSLENNSQQTVFRTSQVVMSLIGHAQSPRLDNLFKPPKLT